MKHHYIYLYREELKHMIKTIVDRLFNVLQLTLDYLYQLVITLIGREIVEIEPDEEPVERERIGFK